MIELPTVTLIAIASITIDEAIKALLYSSRDIRFNKIKLLTDANIIVDPKITVETCSKISTVTDYSNYMIYDLYKHVDTEHCLIVHPDGFVTHPAAWDDEFLKYDYIGAPWPLMDDNFISPFNEQIRVGNGGFNLRSKRLLSLSTEKNILVDIFDDPFYKTFGFKELHDDAFICVHKRHVYEQYGITFAPLELSARFSKELDTEIKINKPTFGAHGININDFC